MVFLKTISIVHHWPWDYCDPRPTWLQWIYHTEHDSYSLYWMIFGFEINWMRNGH